MIPGTTFDINIAEEVWRKEGRKEGYTEARKEFQAEIEELKKQIIKLQGK